MTLLFDLDGTVIDSTEAILESFGVTFETHRFQQAPAEEVKRLIGHPLAVMFRELGVEDAHVDNFVTTYKQHYRTIANQKTVLLPRAAEAIRLASEFATLGVVTTKTGRYSRDILDILGVGCYFTCIVGFEDVTHPKPHAEPVEKALEAMRASKENAWMIGDTHMDILSAEAAGIGHVAVSSGYEGKEALRRLTERVEDDVYEAVEYLKNYHR